MKLQKATLFALYAALELAREPQRQFSTSEIAEKYGVSTHHLAKVMRNLVRAGMIESVRGVGGGYRFAGDVDRTTLLDVIRLFEPMGSELGLSSNASAAAVPTLSGLRHVSDEMDDLMRATLDSITLKTLLKNISNETGHGAPVGATGE